MVTALEYGLIAVISVAGIATVNHFAGKPINGKPSRPVVVITTLSVQPAAIPADLGVFLAPDLKRVRVWGDKSLVKN